MVRHKNARAEPPRGRGLKHAERRKRPPVASSGPVALPERKKIGFPHSGKDRLRDQAVMALLSSSTVAEAAKLAGIGYRTLKTWRTQPEFMAEYRRAKQEMLEAATGRLHRAMAGAVDVLDRVANGADAPTAARVTAAARILEIGFHAHEIDELTARLEKLEREMAHEG